MTEDIVCISRYFIVPEAYIASSILESEGIWSFIADNSMGMLEGSAIAFGGVRLMVRESDAEKAYGLLHADVAC